MATKTYMTDYDVNSVANKQNAVMLVNCSVCTHS